LNEPNPNCFEKTEARGQKYLIMVKLAETLIKSTEQLFFIPPVMLSLRQLWISKFLQLSGAMKHNIEYVTRPHNLLTLNQ
jgi:hypothetical protein